jgi:hypothetical protein
MMDAVIPWDDLVEISIVTTPDGPVFDDVFWVFTARDGRSLRMTQDEADGRDLLPVLQALPRFDNEAVIRAMQSVDHAKFVVWSK